MAFSTGGSEAMRIDSSGNLLVGKTDTSVSVDGVKIQPSGQIVATQASADVLRLNRKTSDGTIIDLRKDGSTVGSIGSEGSGGRLYMVQGDTGLGMQSSVDSIIPVSANGASRGSAIDLGFSTVPFKDLYLSGGVYLGGTGAANKLDDYETGTFTMGVTFVSSDPTAGPTQANGYYVKTGNSCTIWVKASNINVTGGAGDLRLNASGGNDGLPFVSLGSGTTGVEVYMGLATMSNLNVASTCVQVNSQQLDGVAYIRFTEQLDNGTTDVINVGDCTDGSTNIDLCMTYPVA